MATPVIRSLTPAALTLAPGQSAQVTVDAFDPDAQTGTAVYSVADAAGHTATVTQTITIGDPLTYEASSAVPGVTVTQDPVNPARWTVTVAS